MRGIIMPEINPAVYGTMTGLVLFLAACVILLIFLCIRQYKRVKKQSLTDALTGGPNRRGFCRAASGVLAGQSRQYAVIYLHIHNFRHFRTTFGIHDSNRLSRHLYQVLRSCLSSLEPIGVLDGSSFCFLLKNRNKDDVIARLSRIAESTNHFNDALEIPYPIALRFGICFPDPADENADELLEKAIVSLQSYPEHIPFCFSKETGADSQHRKWEQLTRMVRSLKNGEFVVYMQPKVRLGDNRIIGAEALLRWRHPQRGLLTPEMFLPILEEYEQIHRFDLYLFETVCRKMAEWKQAGCQPCPVSVNLSSISSDTLLHLESCSKIIKNYGLKPEWFEFEVDMCGHPDQPDRVSSLISQIHSYGFGCALDHFGAGPLPLHMLHELQADTLKLDCSLFSLENNSSRSRFIVDAILKFATQAQIRTVAEGIDSASQLQYLQQAGCDSVQGFCYFRPMPIEDFHKTVYKDGILRYASAAVFSSATLRKASIPLNTGNKNIVMFSFLTGEDRIVFSDNFSPLLNGQLAFSNAMSLFERSDLIHENDRTDFLRLLDRCRKEDGWVENTLRFYTSEARYEWLEVHLHKEMSTSGLLISGTLVNVAEWKNQVRLWKDKANRDALTGLYNREYFEQFTTSTLKKGLPGSAALVFMDVDDFKRVNDTLGHTVGDDVLCFVSRCLLGAFRHTDIVARYAGDEFVVFVNGIDRVNLEKRLTQLCESMQIPFRNDTVEYPVSGSIGAAVFPEDGRSYQELLLHADSAAYIAKRSGKNRFVFYQPGMEEAVSS